MIIFERRGRMSIHLRFDNVGLRIICNALNSVNKEESASFEVAFDRSVISLKNKSPTEVTQLRLKQSTETRLVQIADDLIWYLDSEDLKLAIERFEECENESEFSPAEFLRVKIERNKKLDYIYCDYV